MKADRGAVRSAVAVCMSALGILPLAANAQAAPDSWQWRASIYAWLPTIDSTSHFPTSGSAPPVDISASDILDALKFTFMGNLEARKGKWGVFNDVIYVDVGHTKTETRDLTVGGATLPAGATANLSMDLKTWAWTFAGLYGLSDTPNNSTELVFGGRMIYVKETLDWGLSGNIGSIGLPGRSGRSQLDATNWDAIIGLKGVATLSADRRWVLPYYVDIGTGESKFTWQALAGVGYSFDWATMTLAYRHLEYSFDSGAKLEDIKFSGPFFGLTFRW